MTKKMLHSKIMIFLLAIILFLFPMTIGMPDQTQSYSVVLAVGIDKYEDIYEVSTQILTSKTNQGFLESLQVHSAKGKNMLDAVEELSLHLGRISGFGNTSAIVFSEEVAKEGIAEMLDFFLRSKRLNGNPFILITKKSAKDILSDVAKIDESFNYSLNSLAKLNQEFANGTIITLNDFLNNFYSGTTASVIAQIDELNDEIEGILIPESNTSGSSGGANGQTSSSSQSGSQEDTKVISNKGVSSLFVGSKQIATLSPDQVEGMNIFFSAKRNSYTVTHVNDEIYHDATVVLSIKSSYSLKRLEFSKAGNPQVHYFVDYILKVEQIMQNGTDQVILDGSNNYLTETLKKDLMAQIKGDAADVINLFKGYNADVFGIQQLFYKHHPKKWQQFLKSIAKKDEAFKYIDFFLNVKLTGNL